MNWTEEAFWTCSWGGFRDAWSGYRRYRLGLDDDDAPMTRREAEGLERDLLAWRDQGARHD